MNNLSKIKKIISPFSVILISAGLIALLYLIALAATSYQVNSGATVTVDEWSACKKVTNNNSLALFVPTNTELEWTTFKTNAPNITLADCVSVPSAPVFTRNIVGDYHSITLNWTAPFDGGSSIYGYVIYRGLTSGTESYLTQIGNVLTYTDTGLTDGTQYFYKVSALNSIGEGALSNEVSTYVRSNRVFVTSTTYNGNLGGLAGADAKCAARATAAGLSGTWQAWISSGATDITDAASRLPHSSYPYVNILGEKIADNWADIVDGYLDLPITYNENGGNSYGAWTGTTYDGTHYFSQDCSGTGAGWTVTTGTGGDAGLSGLASSASGSWTHIGANSCSSALSLYCFEQPNDETPPSAIANLAGASATLTSIDVSWTSPGDDGATGTATSYDLRYSTSAINESNFASATQVSGEPAPLVAGSTQSMTISGLNTNVTYYFAIKTTDDMSNTSSISNSLAFDTKHYTAIVFATPASRTLTPDCIQYPATATGCSSKPYFYCSPWVDGSLVSVDSPGTGRTINYQGAYSTRSAAISATISSMATCFASNGYSSLSYNAGAPDFVHGSYRGCSGSYGPPNTLGGCVGNWQYSFSTGGYYLRPANTIASYYNATYYYYSYTGVFEQIQRDPICPDCISDYYVRMLSYDCTPDTYGYKPQLGECASVSQSVTLYSTN